MTIKEVVESGIPRQVMFYDGDGMCPGIMLGDKIICGCCGGVCEVDQIIEYAKADGVVAIRMFHFWVDISTEISGESGVEELEGMIALEMEEN